MAAFNQRKTGYATLAELMISLINDLIKGSGSRPDESPGAAAGSTIIGDSGMKLIFPHTPPNLADNLHPTTGYFQSDVYYGDIIKGPPARPVARYILESTREVDVMSLFHSTDYPFSASTSTTTTTTASPTSTTTTAAATVTPTLPPYGTFANTKLSTGWRICIEFPLEDTATTAIPGPGMAGSTGTPAVVIGTPITTVLKGAPKVFKDFVSVYVGTSVQLRNDGTVVAVPVLPIAAPTGIVTFLEPAGLVGAAYRPILTTGALGISDSAKAILPPLTASGLPAQLTAVTTSTATPPVTTDTTPINADWNVGFYNRIGVDKTSGYAVPLNYEITLTQRGIFFGVWDTLSESTGVKFNWVLVQRSVDRASGAIRGRPKTKEFGQDIYTRAVDTFVTTTKNSVKPVWCVNSVNGYYYKFNPREEDIGAPSYRTSAVFNTEDSTANINPFDQQSLTDDSKYVITFLSNLNTNRFKYPDELDMVGTVSSDVIGNGTEATVTVYGEPVDRVYRALPPNQPYGTGMRLVSFVKWSKTFAVTDSIMTQDPVTDVWYNEVTFVSWPTTPFDPIVPFLKNSIITIEGYDITRVVLNGTFAVSDVTVPSAAVPANPSATPPTPAIPSVTKVKYATTASALIAAPSSFTAITITGEIVGGPMSETGQ
jgi:hypothetical protein